MIAKEKQNQKTPQTFGLGAQNQIVAQSTALRFWN